MAGNNPRKFKDRIALLNQKQAESTEQFEVSSVILIKRWESEIYKLEKLLPPLKMFKIEKIDDLVVSSNNMDLTQKVMRDVESVRKPVGLPFDTVDIPVIVIITVMLESLVWDGMFGEPLICLLSY